MIGKHISPAIGEFAIEELSRVKAKLVEVKKERDELARLRAEDSWLPREQLAAAQAEIARLREAINASLDTVAHTENARNILVNALATTSLTDALDARLTQERERCARVATGYVRGGDAAVAIIALK